MRNYGRAMMLVLALLAAQGLWAQAVQVRGKLSRTLTLTAGAQQQDAIELVNTGTEPAQVRIYQTDFLRKADGTADYLEPELGSNPRSNVGWLTVTPKLLMLAPQERTQVLYSVQAPADGKLAGSYWSVIMVEPQVAAPATPEPEAGQIKVAIRTVVRYAVVVNVNIGDTGVRSMKFMDKRVVAKDGKRALELDLLNTGERQLTPVIWAEFYGADGALVARVADRQRSLLPGCSIRSALDITTLPAGKYEVLVVADNGDDYVFGARYTLDL